MRPLLKMQIDEHVNNIKRREKKEAKKRKLEEENGTENAEAKETKPDIEERNGDNTETLS